VENYDIARQTTADNLITPQKYFKKENFKA
jgi:hypothetical protein